MARCARAVCSRDGVGVQVMETDCFPARGRWGYMAARFVSPVRTRGARHTRTFHAPEPTKSTKHTHYYLPLR